MDDSQARVFTFMALQRGDGGIRLPLQLQQRDLPRVIADKGMLRLMIVSDQGVRALTHRYNVQCYYLLMDVPMYCAQSKSMKNEGYCRQEAQAVK